MSKKAVFESVKADVDIPGKETEVLNFWKSAKIFEKSLEQTKGKPFYSFYDGPPFATGLPHYGHLLAGTLKDIVPRYWTMRGYHVPRRFGWDCHGLPVEYEIDKSLKIENRKQVFAMGVDKYNAACRSIVTRYAAEWRKTVDRIGRWVDMDNAYFTMNPEFMQSVWWVFQQLWNKGLVYEGYKVVPYSVGCSTTLSNFEANLNYKDIQDPALTVAFKALKAPTGVDLGSLYFLAWTTTPWTLPSNLALAVGNDFEYALVHDKNSKRNYILVDGLVAANFKTEKGKEPSFEILKKLKGSDLVGLTYEPLFPYFKDKSKEGAYQVVHSDHVTIESGTGIVHIAPAYGEDDYFVCQKNNIPVVNPVDDDGMFTADVPDYVGRRVTDDSLNKEIAHRLKEEGKLFHQATFQHSYPFCWRSDTKLIYRAVSTWFVRVEKIKEAILKANKETNWVPDHLRDGRFGNWLENARDWAISRNRFWGTPIPIWQNAEGETMVVGSIAELEKLTNSKVTDLHMEFIDQLTIPSPTGKSPLKRIGPVLDCWFESGSMPYAERGYPFKNKEDFEKGFPAEFIAEGLDQTRGWFYTLTVIGAALFGKSPFKNVVVNGLILAEDGKKMSKSLRNYPDPNGLLNEHGADALRLYMIDSPVVRAQELRFSEKGVRDVVRRIMLRWWNSYSFFVSYANIDGFIPKGDARRSPNILDQWILSKLNTLIDNTNREMEAYRLYNVVPNLLQFVEELTNTYIRFNRSHFWAEGMPEDKRMAYETLFEVLTTLSKVMAPFAPFMADTIYLNLSKALPKSAESVHLTEFPTADKSLLKPELEDAVQRMEQLVMMGRNLREQFGVKAKIPLNTMRVIHRDPQVLKELKVLESYFVDELNIRQVIYEPAEEKFVEITTKANFQALGKRLGPKMKAVAAGIQKLQLADILDLEAGKNRVIEGETISLSDLDIRRAAKAGVENLQTHQLISIQMDPSVSEDQITEGLSREVIRRIQMARKAADFNLDDRVKIELQCGEELRKATQAHLDKVKAETLAVELQFVSDPAGKHIESSDVDGDPLQIGLTPITKNV